MRKFHLKAFVDQTNLPKSAQSLADLIGYEATLKLAAKAKHRSIYVPYGLNDTHWISRTIGYAKAYNLLKEFGGQPIPIATCKHYYASKRNLRIREEYKSGSSTRELADKYAISQRRVQHIIDKAKKSEQI